VLVPEDAELTPCTLTALIDTWVRASGGIGPRFEWKTDVTLLGEVRPASSSQSRSGPGKKDGTKGAGADGGLVALIWDDHETGNQDGWDGHIVGDIDLIRGSLLAEKRPEYAELMQVDTEIPTVVLNTSYRYLKEYMHSAAEELTDEGREARRDRYAIGIGVALLVLDAKQRKDEAKRSGSFSEDVLREAQRAAARGVLSVLPEYDLLYKEVEIGD
jgi:hypothetical protein